MTIPMLLGRDDRIECNDFPFVAGMMMNPSSFFRYGMVTAAATCLVVLPLNLTGCSDSDEPHQLNVGEEENANQGDDTDAGVNVGGSDDIGAPSGSDDTGNDDPNQGNDDPNQGNDDPNQGNDDPNQGNDDPNQGNDDPNQQPGGSSTTQTLVDEQLELTAGYTDTVEFEVPDNVYSVAISVTEGPPSNQYLITDWQGPNGFQLVPDGWESTEAVCYQNCPNRVMASPGAFGGLAPNNPDSQVEPGTHQFRVGTQSGMGFLYDPSMAQSNNNVRVTVHAEIVDGSTDQGTIDLNLFFTGANGWTASTAPDDPILSNIIAEVDTLYDQVGIDIGEIAYHDADESYQVIEDLMSGTGDLAQLLSKSSRTELEGPSVFFVNELRMGGFGFQGGAVLGISGGIPGPMIVNGSPRSGVAVATDSSQATGAPGIAHVTAHELGHYLGLFHTSEQFAMPGTPGHDPLPDTPEDDPGYLMHATGGGDTMSEWQGRVMRKNPWVYFD